MMVAQRRANPVSPVARWSAGHSASRSMTRPPIAGAIDSGVNGAADLRNKLELALQ
jgi:hypothetical protein